MHLRIEGFLSKRNGKVAQAAAASFGLSDTTTAAPFVQRHSRRPPGTRAQTQIKGFAGLAVDEVSAMAMRSLLLTRDDGHRNINAGCLLQPRIAATPSNSQTGPTKY
jgi:hypothetical protein